LREALDAFVDVAQRNVTGTVRLKLYKGKCHLAGVKSPKSLYNPHLASFTMGAEYDPTDATGFIKLFGLPMQVAGLMDRQKAKAGKKTARKKK
jgi:argininosuccinate synthase